MVFIDMLALTKYWVLMSLALGGEPENILDTAAEVPERHPVCFHWLARRPTKWRSGSGPLGSLSPLRQKAQTMRI